jgi:hypothetical protein
MSPSLGVSIDPEALGLFTLNELEIGASDAAHSQ